MLFIIFLMYGTIFQPFNDLGKNLLLIFLGPALLVTIFMKIRGANLRAFFHHADWLVLFLTYYLLSATLNFQSIRFSSLGYSIDLIFCFAVYHYLLKLNLDRVTYIKWIHIIISGFFIVLVIQQVQIAAGGDSFLNKLDSTNYDIPKNYIFSLTSLSTEPSYGATIISVLIFSLIKITKYENHDTYGLKSIRRDALPWLMYLYQLVSYRSVYGILFFIVILIYLSGSKKLNYGLPVLLIGTLIASFNIDFRAFNRLREIVQGLDIKDIENLAYIDHSASIRVLPLYHYITTFKFLDYHSYLGYGLDYSQPFLRTLIPGIPDDMPFGGLIPSFLFDFGILGFVLLWKVLHKFTIDTLFSTETLMLLMVMVNATINTQLFWFVVIVFSINKILRVDRPTVPAAPR